jgi:hypothetical protein
MLQWIDGISLVKMVDTVDERNPAPVGKWLFPL